MFDNWCDAGTTADVAKVIIKNGTINAEKWLICLSGSNAIANAKQIDLTFDDVDFKFAANNDKTDGWVVTVHNQTYNKNITSNITFTDCTFDTTDMRSSIVIKNAPVLNLDTNNKDGVDYVKVNLTVNGGKIIANRFEKAAFYQVHSDDIVTFGKGSDDSYITLEMPNGKTPATPTDASYFTVGEEQLYFHKATVGETDTVYTLANHAVVEGTHYCSCGIEMTKCADETGDHKCDVCGEVISECVDEDKDHKCDICGLTSECVDEDKDHYCDLCEKKTECEDANNDHNCDLCKTPITECKDDDKNHNCDICGKELSECVDENKDEICDYCGYVINTYGIKNIDAKYASVQTYPFFVLRYENGVYKFSHAASTFYGAQAGASAIGHAIYSVLRDTNKYDLENGVYVPAKEGGSVVTAVVVMRRDYDLKSGAEYHNNIAHAQGTVIIDLNGHALNEAAGSTKSIFTATVKGWPDDADKVYTFPSTFTFKNGKINVLKYAAAAVGTTDAITEKKPAAFIENSVLTINYEGVTFGLLAGATTTNFAYSTGNSTNNYPSVAKVNVNYKDCVFDLKTNAITTNINIFNNDTTGKDVDCDIVIEGCEIIASSMANVKVANTSTTNGTSLTAKKNENGKYLTLTMPTGSTAPEITNTVMIDSGAICAFVKTSETVENANYTLYPAVMVGYKIKTSVTLYSNFVYNVYIPKANVDSFTINGAAMNYEEVELDGVTYYHVAVNLPAGETLQDIKVCVSLVSGETTVNANWTLSTLKYTKSVLAGEYNDVTKTLMKDMLVYAAAAHTYFENTEKVAEKLSEVAALLEGYTKEMPEGEAKKPTDKTYFTDVTVYLGEVPSFRFTLAEGYTADNFTFKVGTRDATVTAGEGYVEVAMYAYMMLDDVIFTVNGTEVAESYNLYAYYEYANTLNNDNLNAIVEALMKYSAAAEAYRVDFVANYCAHDYVSGVCTKCGKGDPDVGTMTLTAPSSIYSNYAGKDITVTFSKEWYNGEVTFTTDNENVFVENGKIFAKGTFASEVGVTVTAKTEHHTASVVVNVSTFNGGISAERKVQYYETNIIKEENKGGMIFVGDSYFDGENAYPNGSGAFWRDFYQDWAGQKAYLMGMSSAQIDDLEVVSERIVYPMEPTEIVIHIGHNDIHHGPLTVDEFIARLTALVNEYHSKLPEAQIYWLSVDPKRDSADPTNQRHESSFVEAPAVNAAMAALSESTEWFTYVDTTSIFYTKNTAGELTAVNKNMYPSSDASHPTLVAYDLIRIKIEEARGKTFDNVININNVDNHYSIGKGGKTYNVNGDFVISGRLVMTQFVKNNSHLQFSFGTATGNNRPYRFLLWDASSDGKFGIGYEKIGSYTDENASGKTLYDATNGLVINWTVVVKDGDAYWFVGGKLQAVFEDVALSGTFNIDACGMDAVLYDINLVERTAENEAAYNQYIYPYFADDVANIEMNGQNGDITAAGKTFTDAAGNNLTNNYIVTGKLDIQNFGKSNPHIQFRVGPNYRFLLWDSNRDGKFGAGYTEGSSSASDTKEGITLYNAIGGITFDWAVVVNEGKAYWYLNGKLEKTFEAPTLQAFNLGALQADAYFYDIEICTKAENPELFGLILGEYNGSTVYVNNYKCASGTNISNTGKTFTVDTNGTAISGNYVARGSLRTTAINLNNAHIQFKVKDGYRFLLWDNDNDGKFGAGRIASGSTQISDKTTGAYIIDATENGLELEWAVIVKDGMAYFFIDGVLRVTFAVTGSTSFNIGALQIDVMFYNIEIYVDDTSNASDNYDQVVAGYEIPNN